MVIEDDDALTVMQRYDTADTLHYLDPPYLAETRNARQAGMAYAVDMATPAQHRALIAVARELRRHVVISGYPSALYAELLRRLDDGAEIDARRKRQRPYRGAVD